jgi:uncharacterized membrane protein (UPF0182 family)
MRKGLLIVIGFVAVVALLLVGLSEFITDYLWFKDLGQTSVFWKKWVTMIEIGIPTFLIILVLTFLYLKAINKGYRKRVTIAKESMSEKRQGLVQVILSLIPALALAYLAMVSLWYEFLQFVNSTSFDLDDPIFSNDVSFYVFKLQFIRDMNTFILYVVGAFVLVSFVYYMFLLTVLKPAAVDGTPVEEEEEEEPAPRRTFGGNLGGGGGLGGMLGGMFGGGRQQQAQPRKKSASVMTAFPVAGSIKELVHIASKQIAALGVIFFLMLGFNFFLKQFDLLYTKTGVVFGAGFTDINVTLWMFRILIGLSVLAAITFVLGLNKKKLKTVLLVPIAMALVYGLGTGAALLMQNLVVSPDEINKETKYLEYNIRFTQLAYDLQDVSTVAFQATNTLTSEDIQNNMDTLRNIRINDYDPAKTFYNSTQTIRQYYTFNDVDVDRYMINGDYTQVFLSAREIDESKISQEWLNVHLKYTHGYGITLSRVDKVTASGQPDIMIKDIPPVSQVEEIDVTRPEIYFGELQNEYIITNTDEKEFDYPDGDTNQYNLYEGANGIKLNLFNRLMFAISERSAKLLVSSNINSDSKIIINRNITSRVRAIMPYLQYSDPYIVTVDGGLYWIIDAYTLSDDFPYSEPYAYSSGDTTNYIRNSVKVIINAYTGDTDYYIVDETDPVAATMAKIYPTLFKEKEEMPEELLEHIRYPATMLNIQANIYKKYHVNDINVFYQGEDQWDIANEKVGAAEKEVAMEPQYYIMKLPGETEVEFINSIPYTPMNKTNMTGLLIARNDGENYGKLMLLQLPKSKVIMGPSQIDAQIAQDTEISKDFSLWENSGSTYRRGNMFVVPIEDSIMYVEPIYLQASDSSLPEVKRIVLYYDDRIAYAETLADALDIMFGAGTGDALESTGGDESVVDEGGDVPPDSGIGNEGDDQQKTTDELIALVVDHYNKAIAAQKAGDWATYGAELEKMEEYLKELDPSATFN